MRRLGLLGGMSWESSVEYERLINEAVRDRVGGVASADLLVRSFDFSVINVDGSGSGVITLAVGTGWTIVGLATVAATAGTTQRYRARKTGVGAWTLYTLA